MRNAKDAKTKQDTECDKLLRTKIIESQTSQADFMKWKPISVAAVASVSLGFTPTGNDAGDYATLLMCLVPFICAYVDLIYLRKAGYNYEIMVFDMRDKVATNPFAFEETAMLVSSAVFNAGLIVLGFTLKAFPQSVLDPYIVSGMFGIFATFALWLTHSARRRQMENYARDNGKQIWALQIAGGCPYVGFFLRDQ